ncbi:hypothetical protein ACLB2K_076980 [Fragaria x ananassa]
MATYRALLSLKSSLDDPDSRLSALSALRLLNLSNNVFNRTFPPELSNLTNLRVLDLYNNNLTGHRLVALTNFDPDQKTSSPTSKSDMNQVLSPSASTTKSRLDWGSRTGIPTALLEEPTPLQATIFPLLLGRDRLELAAFGTKTFV